MDEGCCSECFFAMCGGECFVKNEVLIDEWLTMRY